MLVFTFASAMWVTPSRREAGDKLPSDLGGARRANEAHGHDVIAVGPNTHPAGAVNGLHKGERIGNALSAVTHENGLGGFHEGLASNRTRHQPGYDQRHSLGLPPSD